VVNAGHGERRCGRQSADEPRLAVSTWPAGTGGSNRPMTDSSAAAGTVTAEVASTYSR
jgi:hypothetical protein